MSYEESLIKIRKEKHQEMNGASYPLATDPSALPFAQANIEFVLSMLEQLRGADKLPASISPDELGDNNKYLIRGRITALRKSGSIIFIKLSDITGFMQVIISKSSFLNYDRLKLFDLGDIVEVCGRGCQSKTGETSLLAFSVTLLTKAHRPPPEKFAGIVDQELRYRKRYLDLMSSEETRARFIVRTYAIRAIREFMEKNNFLEVETPTLGTIVSGANAKPFVTHHNALDMDMRLRIAPELYLKRLLVGGLDRVFEIGRNYRNEGIDTRHNPEFTMMESYQAYGNFKQLTLFTKSLLQYVCQYLTMNLPTQAARFYQTWAQEASYDLFSWVEISMHEAVANALRVAELEFSNSDIHALNTNNQRLQKIDVSGMTHDLNKCLTEGERLAILFEYVAEPFLTEDYRNSSGTRSVSVIITDYPKDISPLARENDSNSAITDRFELFVGGRELANAFQELNDPKEQSLRFQQQLSSSNKDPMNYDSDYVEALEYGMPPAIGFGIGVDRLVMLLTNTSSIKDVILFPTLRPE